MPSWAADSWVDSDRSAVTTPPAPASPARAASSARPRSTVVRENSAATKKPVSAVSTTAARRSNHSVIGLPVPAGGPPQPETDDPGPGTAQGPPPGGP